VNANHIHARRDRQRRRREGRLEALIGGQVEDPAEGGFA